MKFREWVEEAKKLQRRLNIDKVRNSLDVK